VGIAGVLGILLVIGLKSGYYLYNKEDSFGSEKNT
jgi:hypothetical protein